MGELWWPAAGTCRWPLSCLKGTQRDSTIQYINKRRNCVFQPNRTKIGTQLRLVDTEQPPMFPIIYASHHGYMEDAVTINPIPARAYRKSQPMHAGGAPTAPRRFACTVLNLSIYFCLALCFLRSRSHKLFKTPKNLKIYFENIFLRWFFEKRYFFWKSENFWTFFAKNRKVGIFWKKNVFSDFRENFNIFDFSRKKFEIFSFSKISKKYLSGKSV